MKEDLSYTTARGHQTGLSLYGSNLPADAPCIVYLHGFKGFKDWGFVPFLAESLVGEGFRVLAMNFSHNGIGDDPMEFGALDRFRDNTFSLEVEEAREVVTAYYEGKLFDASPGAPIGLIGHSRGGGIALLASRELQNSMGTGLKGVCTWASVSTFFRYPEESLAQWKKDGVIEMLNTRTKQMMQLGWGLAQDMLDHGQDQLSIEKATRLLSIPLCIVHGTDDEAVSVNDAHDLFEWSDNNAVEIHELPGTGHTFGAKHPFDGSNPSLDHAILHTINFFTHQLKA
jgi:pimeloyl-ACP methyl ester carboxylesterase